MRHLFRAILLVVILVKNGSPTFALDNKSIDSLNRVAFELRNNDRPKSKAVAQLALKNSISANYADGQYEAKLNLGIHYHIQKKADSAYLLLQEAHLYFKQKSAITDQLGYSNYYLARIYSDIRDYSRMEASYNKALEIFEKTGNRLFYSFALNGLGTFHGKQSNFVKALEYFSRAYELKMEAGEDASIELNNICIAYRNMGQLKEAIEFGKKSFRSAESNKDTVSMITSFDSLGDVFEDDGQADSALWYYGQALLLAEQINDLQQQSSIKYEMGILQRKNGDFLDAISTYHQILNSDVASSKLKESSLLQLANAYFDMGRADSATLYARRAFEAFQLMEDYHRGREAALLLKKLYKQTGNAGLALTYSDFVEVYRDSLDSRNKADLFSDLRVQLETLEKVKSIELLEKQSQIDTLTIQRLAVFIVASALLILLTSSLIWFWYKGKQRTQQQESDRLKMEVQQSREALNRQTLHMMHVNNSLSEVEENLRSIPTEQKSREVQQVLKKINMGKALERDWENFDKYFGNVHGGFFQKLNNLSDNLTLHEKRVCALVRLNLNNREISTILNIEANSVKMVKYRIKKRLQLDESVDLYQFLNELTDTQLV